MSAHENDELIDYEDDNEGTTTVPTTAANGNGAAVAKATEAAPTGDDKDKRAHAGVHSTGFRYEEFSVRFDELS